MFHYYTANTICVIFMMFIMFLLTSNNVMLEEKRKKMFYTITLLVTVCTIVEWCCYALNGNTSVPVMIHRALKAIEFSLTPVIPVLLGINIGYEQIGKKITVFLGLNVLFEIVSAQSGFIFYYDASNTYHHGPYFWLYMMFCMIGMVFAIYAHMEISKNYYRKNRILIPSSLIFLCLASLSQVYEGALKMNWLCGGIVVFVSYVLYGEIIQQTDSVTGLMNRRSFESMLSGLNHNAVLLFLDVDQFKKINDRYGHAAGDQCLRVIGKGIYRIYGKEGFCYRIGGDEFCVILEIGCELEGLRQRFDNYLINQRTNVDFLPDVSMGHAEFHAGIDHVSDVMKMADQAMYDDKNERRKIRK